MNETSKLPRQSEVVVVGAGVMGCSIAYQLARRGRQVLVIERRGIGSGASGRNGGLTGAGSALHVSDDPRVPALTVENLRLLREELPAELGADFRLRLPGTLDIATDEAQYQHLVQTVRAQRAQGLSVDLLDRQELRALLPGLSEHVLGARLAHDHGHLWPFDLVHALANGARRHGARFVTGTEVQKVLRSNGVVRGVRTVSAAVEAETVVLATNAWTPSLLPELPTGAIVPARGQILVTEPVPPLLHHPFNTNYDKEYGRQTIDGQILCGGFRRLDTNEGLGELRERVSAPVLRGIAGCLRSLFPGLRRVEVVRAWAGIMGFTPDGLPLLGRLAGTSGLVVAAGFNGGGFSWALAAGKALAEQITEGRSALDLAPFDPARLWRSNLTWRNPFTAGERNNPAPPAGRAG